MSAYYNEFDPQAAAWLRELIKQGHIAAGDVDDRDMREVHPDDLKGYKQHHFFAGIGGWSLALRYAGWDDARPVLTGSPPCQPFSSAGKGLGAADERHLAPHFLRLVSAIRPACVFGEQVATAVSKDNWLDDLLDELEAEGYTTGAVVLPACGIGAPHIRQRLWFTARLEHAELQHQRSARGYAPRQGYAFGSSENSGLADTESQRSRQRQQNAEWCFEGSATKQRAERQRSCSNSRLANAQRNRSQASRQVMGSSGVFTKNSDDSRMADTQCGRSQIGNESKGRTSEVRKNQCDSRLVNASGSQCEAVRIPSGVYAQHSSARDASAFDGLVAGQQIDWDEARRGEVWASPTQAGWNDPDWLFCRDGKWRPVESGTFPLADGIPARVGRLRGYGNAIVPQVAAEIIKTVMEEA